MPEFELRERIYAQLPADLAAKARALVEDLKTLESGLFALANDVNAGVDASKEGTLTDLAAWVERSDALEERRAEVLQWGALVNACAGQGVSTELTQALAARLVPFLQDIAEAQAYFRQAAGRAAAASQLNFSVIFPPIRRRATEPVNAE